MHHIIHMYNTLSSIPPLHSVRSGGRNACIPKLLLKQPRAIHQHRLQAIAEPSDALRSDFQGGSGLPQPIPQQDKVGVLLLNLGGPDRLEDVQPFLYNLFADPDIIRLPAPAQFLQPFLAWTISTLRAPKSAEGYKAIGGGSPLRRITEEQAEALQKGLRSKGIDASVYVGMRYWNPFTEEALEQVCGCFFCGVGVYRKQTCSMRFFVECVCFVVHNK